MNIVLKGDIFVQTEVHAFFSHTLVISTDKPRNLQLRRIFGNLPHFCAPVTVTIRAAELQISSTHGLSPRMGRERGESF